MPPEIEEEVQAETTQETPEGTTPAEGAAEGGEQDGGGEGSPKRKLAGKYDTPEALETGYTNALEQLTTVQRENAELREEKEQTRAEHAAQTQEAGTTPPPGATSGSQNPADLPEDKFIEWYNKCYVGGRFFEANKAMQERNIAVAQRPILKRVEESENQRAARELATELNTRKASPKRWPGYEKLEDKMHDLLEARTKRNPQYGLSFASIGDMLDSIYADAARLNPDLVPSGGRSNALLAGDAGSGSRGGDGGRPPGPKKPKRNSKDWTDIGLPVNEGNDDMTPEDRQIVNEQARRDALAAAEQPSAV